MISIRNSTHEKKRIENVFSFPHLISSGSKNVLQPGYSACLTRVRTRHRSIPVNEQSNSSD
jgi:hypothetical protein